MTSRQDRNDVQVCRMLLWLLIISWSAHFFLLFLVLERRWNISVCLLYISNQILPSLGVIILDSGHYLNKLSTSPIDTH